MIYVMFPSTSARFVGVSACTSDLQPVILRNCQNVLSIKQLATGAHCRSLGVGVGLGVGLGIGVRAQEKKAVRVAIFYIVFKEQTDGRQRPEIRGGSTPRMPCGANTPAQAPQEHERVPGVLPVRQRRAQISGEILSRLGCTV